MDRVHAFFTDTNPTQWEVDGIVLFNRRWKDRYERTTTGNIELYNQLREKYMIALERLKAAQATFRFLRLDPRIFLGVARDADITTVQEAYIDIVTFLSREITRDKKEKLLAMRRMFAEAYRAMGGESELDWAGNNVQLR